MLILQGHFLFAFAYINDKISPNVEKNNFSVIVRFLHILLILITNLVMIGYQSMQLKSNAIKLLGQNLTVKSAIECASRCNIAFDETSRYLFTIDLIRINLTNILHTAFAPTVLRL
jgi:hypothetical protein